MENLRRKSSLVALTSVLLVVTACAPADAPGTSIPAIKQSQDVPPAPVAVSGKETVPELLQKVRPELRDALNRRLMCLVRPDAEGKARAIDTDLVKRAIVEVSTNPAAASAC